MVYCIQIRALHFSVVFQLEKRQEGTNDTRERLNFERNETSSKRSNQNYSKFDILIKNSDSRPQENKIIS